jgi:outer membrane protein assembly factor BamB
VTAGGLVFIGATLDGKFRAFDKDTGALLWDVVLPGQGTNGNGIGIPAAPTIADLDGDGQLDIIVSTFDHGIDVFSVPGSGTSCLPWPTGRGSLLRAGRALVAP